MKHARLTVHQRPRNPTQRERTILLLLAEGHTQKQAAGHLGLKPRSVTSAIERMRDRYTAPTIAALIALAVHLQWIAVAIDIHQADGVP
jgi:DNA-binding CsgD family transcriptional regulator